MSANTNGAPRGRGGARGGRGKGMARGSRTGILGGSTQKAGPRPARHIPWPEIFRHHISLVEGHLKMIDMVRKHTVEGSGNHRTIVDLITRSNDMLRDAKLVQREFVAPKDAWKDVPIGSSSETMYPGYSPKHHEYGKAAEEFGKMWSDAKKKGAEFKTAPDGPEYEFGQGKGAKRRRVSVDEPVESEAVEQDNSDAPESATNGTPATNSEPLFFFDSNPSANGVGKSTEPPEKKSKKQNEPTVDEPTTEPADPAEPEIETLNIDAEVDARMRLKAESKSKKDKKRKRESAASNGIETTAATEAGHEKEDNVEKQEKPPKKKSKSKKDKKRSSNETSPAPEASVPAETIDVEMKDADAAPDSSSVPVEDEDLKANNKKAKKDKKSKKREAAAIAGSTEDGVVEDATNEKKKKKKTKKEKHQE